jgi:two-component system osmolarity sensor histidine kinase EnvZ
MAGRRFDALFARLMLAQTLLMLLVGLMFVAWLMAARTQATAMPFAQLWAGPLAAAARQPVGAALPEASPGYPVFRQSSLPAGFKSYNLTIGLGFRLWQTEFAARGLAFDDLRFVSTDGPVQLWFHVVRPGDSPVWLQAPRIWPFENFNNVPAALLIPLLMACLFVGLSGWFARRVTRPLQDLRQRMHGDVLAIDAMSPPGAAAASGMARASSEIRAIDHDYQQLLERLRSAELERALLLAGVSHDLRSPLARIRLATELLPQRSDPLPHLAAITRNIDQADRLIGSFLDFVRAGSLKMNDTVDVAAVARSVVARFECAPEVLSLAPASAAVLLPHANVLLIERLLFNLIDNALKHGAAPVRLSVASAQSSGGKPQVLIDVCDAGAGLPEGQAAELMRAFARGDPSRSVAGSGLGLSIVQQIAARMAATLRFVRDAEGHHARVSLDVRQMAGPRPIPPGRAA